MCYADDLLVICDEKSELNDVSKVVDAWAKKNTININYKVDKTAHIKIKHRYRKRYQQPLTEIDIPHQE